MSELKCCPFCGCKEINIIDISDKDIEDDTYYMIECQNCNGSVCFGDNSISRLAAINQWNRRYNDEM